MRQDASHPPTYALARWLFLRLIGLSYLAALVSLWPQLGGLYGPRGILPVEHFLRMVAQRFGPERYWQLPTLCWLHPTVGFLHVLCAAGTCLAVLLIFDVAPAAALVGLWAAYLSLVTVGHEFLAFQWDNLLLEAGFLAIFLAPLRLRPRVTGDAPPSRLALWLLWWLLFRLMFSSGVVKLASGDATWRHLTALTYHYETQPLPTWIGWYAHQLPAWFQRLSCVLMFCIELIVPWFIVGPRRWRRAACAVLIGFQLLIAATGNYCFFNLLTIALCVLLLDDDAWPRRWRERCTEAPAARGRWPAWIIGPMAALIMLLSSATLPGLRGVWRWLPSPLMAAPRWAAPFRTVNGYGLFAVMTTTRNEIVIEGSRDGIEWKPYAFKYKPGDPARRPAFVAPHQPRLDWQMWFAVLGSYRENPWFLEFCGRLLQGSPEVLALLATNPFPDRPPAYIRAVVYEYHFTDPATRRWQGTWWQRELRGLYCPALSLSAS